MAANSLPTTVTRQRRSCDLNPGPTAPKFSTLTTRFGYRNYSIRLIFMHLTYGRGSILFTVAL